MIMMLNRCRARPGDRAKPACLHGLQAVPDQDHLLPDVPAQNFPPAGGTPLAAAVRCTGPAHADLPRHCSYEEGAARHCTPHLWQQSQRVRIFACLTLQAAAFILRHTPLAATTEGEHRCLTVQAAAFMLLKCACSQAASVVCLLTSSSGTCMLTSSSETCLLQANNSSVSGHKRLSAMT